MNAPRTRFGFRTAAAMAVSGAALLFAAQGFAADAPADQKPATTTTAPQNATPDTTGGTQSTTTASAPKHHMMSRTERVEARIKQLHSQLHITAPQEPQWTAVAQVMRDNASHVSDLVKERNAKGSMSAVDDLKSYEAITDAHADGLKKLVPAFETLYASMSDDQKKAADTMFRHVRKPMHHHKS